MNLSNVSLKDPSCLQVKSWLVLLMITFSLDLFAGQQPPQANLSLDLEQDSLLIKDLRGTKTIFVKEGHFIKVWAGRAVGEGEYLGRQGDTLSIKTIKAAGTIQKYHIDDIRQIKIFGNRFRNIVGWPLKIWGGAILGASLSPNFDWGSFEFLIILPAWLLGFLTHAAGSVISGNRRLDLEKDWEIK